MKLKPDTTYKASELTVNRDEFLRILRKFEEHMTEAAQLYGRMQELFKQGSIPTRKHTAQDESQAA